MAYSITLTNGELLVTVEEGTAEDNITDLTLVGKNFVGYGQYINENFVYLLENFANPTPPPSPLTGQVWYDSETKKLKVWDSTGWVSPGAVNDGSIDNAKLADGTVTTPKLADGAVTTPKLARGATLPDYVRAYSGAIRRDVALNTWMSLQLDATSLNNEFGTGVDHDIYRIFLPAGTYFYELAVPVMSMNVGTNDACYTAIIVNPLSTGAGGHWVHHDEVIDPKGKKGGYIPAWDEWVVEPYSYTVLSAAGVNVVGPRQSSTVFGVGRFTLTAPTYISAAVTTTDSSPRVINVARNGFCTTILRIWRD